MDMVYAFLFEEESVYMICAPLVGGSVYVYMYVWLRVCAHARHAEDS